ncbi:hypothetical protein AA0114_g7519 [Alternaria tenuissima]|jgi:hypothetical protein|uniref:Heterokaryon incompatibility domain-containing protein n=1 Tax=Alternaria tenuissima TaxID=119927 RepID=A0A4Q4MBV6_9PLEO|nr:hypothetical protein AA0114_g7519 [Alternaria tenuissima]
MELPPTDVRFTHTPLNFKHKEIRILTIEPSSDPESPIQITIKHIDFSDHVHALTYYQEEKAKLQARDLWDDYWRSDALYNEFFKETLRFIALSYTWGPEFPAQDILVTSPECQGWLSVRQNLYDFLKTRRACGSAWFWIDQICINQGKDDEKTHQVNQMAEIYSAAVVEVWLSSEFEGSNELIDLIVRESTLSTQEPRPMLSVNKQGFRTYVPSLRHLLRIPYWSRLWITQEIVLGKVVDIRIGSKTLPWDTFYSGWKRVNDAWGSLDRSFKGTKEANAQIRIRAIDDGREQEIDDYWSIWYRIRGSECSDLRDQVFGTMGMLDPSFRILPDYSMRPEDILLMILPKIVRSIQASNKLYWDDSRSVEEWNRMDQISCMQTVQCWMEILQSDAHRIRPRLVRHHLFNILLPLDAPKSGYKVVKGCLLKYRWWYHVTEGSHLRMMLWRLRQRRWMHFRPAKEKQAEPFTDDSLFAESDVYSLSIADSGTSSLSIAGSEMSSLSNLSEWSSVYLNVRLPADN